MLPKNAAVPVRSINFEAPWAIKIAARPRRMSNKPTSAHLHFSNIECVKCVSTFFRGGGFAPAFLQYTLQDMEIVLVLSNIRSAHNVGSIMRTADAAGVAKIYLAGVTPAPINHVGMVRQQLTKVSLGAEHMVPWQTVRSPLLLMRKLKEEGYRIFAVEQHERSVPYIEILQSRDIRQARIAFVFGSEIKGLSSSVLKRADKILEIPMRGALVRHRRHPRRTGEGKESLNVAVAAGIVMFGMLHR